MESSKGVSELQKKVAFGIMKYLWQQVTAGVLPEDSVESLEVAIQCIGNTYKLNLNNEDHSTTYGSDNPLEVFLGARTGEISASAQKKAEELKTKGNGHMESNQLEEACECYCKAIELDPTNATYFCNRAAVLTKQRKLEKALSDCQHAIKLNPNYAKAHSRMGCVYNFQGKNVEAKSCFLEAIRLDPNNENYKQNLAMVEKKEGREQQQASACESGFGSGTSSDDADEGIFGLNILDPSFLTIFRRQPEFNQTFERGVENLVSQLGQTLRSIQQKNPEQMQSLRQQALQLMQQKGEEKLQKLQQKAEQLGRRNSPELFRNLQQQGFIRAQLWYYRQQQEQQQQQQQDDWGRKKP